MQYFLFFAFQVTGQTIPILPELIFCTNKLIFYWFSFAV